MARLESAQYVAALRVAERLHALGHAAYLAGGCVRDMLLGVAPKDFDVATDATPEQVIAAFERTESVGAHFGVVLVIEEIRPQGLKPHVREAEDDVRAEARTLQSEKEVRRTEARTLQSEEEARQTEARTLQSEEEARQTETLGIKSVDDGLEAEARSLQSQRVATEVATFRHDGAYSDGRRPDAVRFSEDPREDVLRRDFTINGLLLDVLRYEAGDPLDACVLDYVGGRGDLERRTVRAIGDPAVRFGEDKLRMLRAVRFAARLGFDIEPRTMAAMQAQATEIHAVSAERVRDELTKILTEGAARRGFELLDESGLLRQVLPEIARMHGVEQPPQYHPEGDVWVHTMMLLEHLPAGASATLAWGMLLHDVGKPATFTAPDPKKPGDRIRFNGHVEVGVAIARGILNRFRFSNEEIEQILSLVQHHMQFGDVTKMRQSTLKRFLRLPKFEEHMALHFADCSSAHGDLSKYEFVKEKLAEHSEEEIRPKLLLTGADLIAAGYRPGPAFKAMLTAAEDAQLEGTVSTKEEALELVKAFSEGEAGTQSTQR